MAGTAAMPKPVKERAVPATAPKIVPKAPRLEARAACLAYHSAKSA